MKCFFFFFLTCQVVCLNLPAQEVWDEEEHVVESTKYRDMGIYLLGGANLGSMLYLEESSLGAVYQIGLERTHQRLVMSLQGSYYSRHGLSSETFSGLIPKFYVENSERITNIDFQFGYNFFKPYSRSKLTSSTGIGYLGHRVEYYPQMIYVYGLSVQMTHAVDYFRTPYIPIQLAYEYRVKPKIAVGLSLVARWFMGKEFLVQKSRISYYQSQRVSDLGVISTYSMCIGLKLKYYLK